jgi:aspartate-semialdehyde dehydrogenase
VVDAPLVFSALPASHAAEVEPLFSGSGKVVCTNASAFRAEPDVPLIMPEINPDHTALIERQRRERGWPGAIVANPNCTSAGMTVALHALNLEFGVDSAIAVSFQALSGAGYPGVASLDINDNVIPYVGGEEEKVEWEPRKMMGKLSGSGVALADLRISAHTNRVPVTDGHLVCMSVKLLMDPGLDLGRFCLPEESAGLPSAPDPVIRLHRNQDRPQPRLDRLDGRGMTTGVGRLRRDPILDYKMVVLSHNTIRGAAGGSIYNAELLYRQGWLP